MKRRSKTAGGKEEWQAVRSNPAYWPDCQAFGTAAQRVSFE